MYSIVLFLAYIVQQYTILYCTTTHYTMLYCTMLYDAILYYTTLYPTNTMLHHMIIRSSIFLY